MGKYNGYSCPICGKPFTDNDEISVCPDCGTPHHRSCAINAGKCAFADRHGKYTWQPSEEKKTSSDESLPRRCARCGAENSDTALFCNSCGAPLGKEPEQGVPFGNGPQYGRGNGGYGNQNYGNQNYGNQGYGNQNYGNPNYGSPFSSMYQNAVNPDEPMEEDITYREAAAYIGTNVPYFVNVFHRFRQGKKFHFNWSAFLFSYLYLFYRKMYKIGIVATVISILLSIPQAVLMLYSYGLVPVTLNETLWDNIYLLASFLVLVLRIVVGFFANTWYDRQTVRKVRQVRQTVTSPEKDSQMIAIAQSGGVSFAAVLILEALVMVLSYVMISLMTYLF